jgi:hypothetical protein
VGLVYDPRELPEVMTARSRVAGVLQIAKPMMKLLEKNKTFEWTAECQASFEELKNVLLQHQCWFY